MNPVRVKMSDKQNLLIKWDDKSETSISIPLLRKNCPCATCVAERDKQGKFYIPLLEPTQILISEIKIVGNYALSITWGDGHSTGIYEYTFLKSLSIN